MKDFSYITNSHPEFIENLYRDFVNDPTSVDPELKKFFEGFDFAIGNSSMTGVGNGKEIPVETGKVISAEVDWMREIRLNSTLLVYIFGESFKKFKEYGPLLAI